MRSPFATRAMLFSLLLAGAPALVQAGELDDLAWMAGSWCGVTDRGATQEELWMPPKGGMMLGLHRDVAPSGRSAFEYLRIEDQGDKIVYQASPGGRPPTPFTLVETGEHSAVFENPENEFPKRILYSLAPDGALIARIEAGDRAISWRWQREASCEPPATETEAEAASALG